MLTKEKLPHPGAERQAARTQAADRRPGRSVQDDHHRHQHGRVAAPTSCSVAAIWKTDLRHPVRTTNRCRPEAKRRRWTPSRAEWKKRHEGAPRAACASSVPNATNRASTTSCVAVPAVRRRQLNRFYLSTEDPLIRIFGGDRLKNIMTSLRSRGEPIEAPHHDAPDRESAQLKVEAATSTSASSCLDTTTSPTTSAKAIYSSATPH